MRLGGREFPVPPLTLGRFQRLLSLDTKAVTAALLEEVNAPPPRLVRLFRSALRTAILRGWNRVRDGLWWIVEACGIGRGMYRAAAAADVVATVVPGVTREAWKEHGTLTEALALFVLFARGHEWAYIGEAIRFGEPVESDEALPSPDEVTEGLIVVAKETGHSVEALTAMRLEGFYHLVGALRSKAEALRPERGSLHPDGGPLPGVEYVDGIPEDLQELMRKAREVGHGGE